MSDAEGDGIIDARRPDGSAARATVTPGGRGRSQPTSPEGLPLADIAGRIHHDAQVAGELSRILIDVRRCTRAADTEAHAYEYACHSADHAASIVSGSDLGEGAMPRLYCR